MLVAVAETATAQGKAGAGERIAAGFSLRSVTLFAMRHAAFAALALCGLAPRLSDAQIVPSGAHAPGVINTANGLPQVNVTKPSGAGVSLNTYSQFDVQKNGAILNNSPVITNTQLAGQINGNPNFGANDAARIIVNQVNSNDPSQLRGYVEVAGQKTATVVIANPSGLVVDGGGFINTSRGILTTGNPLIDANGNLSGFNVTQGSITVQGEGFNASNLDQADLIARAVQVNAAIYGDTLNVVTGANNVDYASLNATAIAGSGAALGVSIDVSQLGGMYANRITLVGTENGVGVANAGTIAAQAGDLTLNTQGQLMLTGLAKASGNINVDAAGGVNNYGTVYAQQNTTILTGGTLANSGTLAAQRDTTLTVGSVASTGVLAAGVNDDGTLGASGNLAVSATGLLSATGQTVASGSVTLYGVSLDVWNAQTWAGTALTLTATGGNLSLAGANASAGSALTAIAAGTLDTSGATLNSGADMQLFGARITNMGGQAVSGGTLSVQTAGALDNRQGILQAGGQETVSAGSVDNTAGQILSLDSDGLTVSAAGTLTNDGGTIQALCAAPLTISATQALSNRNGLIGANGNATLTAGTLDNSGGTLAATGDLTVNSAGSLTNDSGVIEAAGNVNLAAAGALSNAGGQIAAAGPASQLNILSASIDNTAGSVTNSGTGALSITVDNAVTNAGASSLIAGNGNVTVTAATLSNTEGATVSAAGSLGLTLAASLVNDGATLASGDALTLDDPSAAVSNVGGSISGGAVIPGVIRHLKFADDATRGTLKTPFPTHDGDLLNLRDLEQGLEQMKRVPNQDATMQIVPGDQPGESDVVVSVQRSKPWSLVVSADNSGTRETGGYLGNVTLGLNNLLGVNDILTAGYNQDLQFGNHGLGTHGWNGSYSVPWGYWTGTLFGYANTYYQQIAGVNQLFMASGNSQTAGLKLERVLHRSQSDVTGVEFQFIKRFGASFIDDTEIEQQRRNNTFIEAGLTNRHYFGAAQFDGALAYRQGVGGFGAMPDIAGGPTYRFHMALLDANLSVPFSVAGQTFRYVGTVHAQFTNDELNYIDDLTIGSRYTVRGFSGETMLAAEKGFYWRNELQYPLAQTGQSLYVGFDYGHLWGPSAAYLAGTQLAGAVLGVRGSVPTRVGRYSYDLFAGTPIYKPAGFPASSVTLGFQFIGQF